LHDFEEFVRTRSAALARTAFLLTGDVHSAEDLLQDALARLAERWQMLRGDDPEPYVRRMLHTGAVDNWRRLRRRLTATQRVGAQLSSRSATTLPSSPAGSCWPTRCQVDPAPASRASAALRRGPHRGRHGCAARLLGKHCQKAR
jgi:DNA-directed RNA polymerase specialized sigma24 family protein